MMNSKPYPLICLPIVLLSGSMMSWTNAFSLTLLRRTTTSSNQCDHISIHCKRHKTVTSLNSSNGNNNGAGSSSSSGEYNSGSASDANRWQSSDILPYEEQEDWEKAINARQDGSLWSSFTSSEEEDENDENSSTTKSKSSIVDDMDDGEAWLDALAKISADEIDFINFEADRADKVRQMQEMEFSPESIAATLGVAVDETQEIIDADNVIFEQFKEETKKTGFGMYVDDEFDMETVESHVMVERDDETGEPLRTQMVYVDEVSCVGCTNCAMVAQSTFFMEQDHGRARVFQQWGDDEETIQIAIETCPVDCIHYVPYEELVELEIERRGQRINNAARLVSQAEGSGQSVRTNFGFTGPQSISGNMKPRCSNCPSRGCKNCPMYGVGKNPNFEKKEAERKMRRMKKRMREEMENSNRSADL